MKCEKHNCEMEWRGPLNGGSMHCSVCEFESANPTIHMDYALGETPSKGPLENEAGPKTFADALVDALAKDDGAGMSIGTFNTQGFAADPAVTAARARIQKADYMISQHTAGQPADCPYCGQYAPPYHTMGHNSCRDRYEADQRIASGYP